MVLHGSATCIGTVSVYQPQQLFLFYGAQHWTVEIQGFAICPRAQDQKSQSMRYKPQPRYAKPQVVTTPTGLQTGPASFNSTGSIRDTIYQEWYAERQEKLRKEKLEKKKKEKEEKEKKEKVGGGG